MKTNMKKELGEWFGNAKGDILAGMVSSFAVIPEVVGFCIVIGISPMMGLYASFFLTVLLSFIGGRPAMISAAAGSMALVLAGLVRDYGPEYLMFTTILCGFIMFLLGVLKIGNLIKLIPNSVQIGFVNALAILIFMSQLGNFKGESWPMYALVALGIAIIYLIPKVTTAIPSTLISVIVVTAISIIFKAPVRTIGDMGEITAALPVFHIPNVPMSLGTVKIVLPYAVSIALVGLVETLLTAQVIDDMTDSVGDKNRECRGLGIANVVSGFFGGTCGCAMIGQAIVNVNSGAKGRLSNFVSGGFLMVLIFALKNLLVQIPLAALVAVMITVSIATFDWDSLKRLSKMPRTDAFVILMVVGVVVATENLAFGVVLGLVFTALFFAMKMSEIKVFKELKANKMIYQVKGQIFFASTEPLMQKMDFQGDFEKVELDLTHSHLWDESAATALYKALDKFKANGKQVEIKGLNKESRQLFHALYGG